MTTGEIRLRALKQRVPRKSVAVWQRDTRCVARDTQFAREFRVQSECAHDGRRSCTAPRARVGQP